jgi:hypothetical protein
MPGFCRAYFFPGWHCSESKNDRVGYKNCNNGIVASLKSKNDSTGFTIEIHFLRTVTTGNSAQTI